MRKYLLGIIAIVFAVAGSAFNYKESKAPASGPYYFEFTGTDQMDQGSYTKRLSQPSPGNVCPGDVALCGIWADEDPQDATQPLQSDINALKAQYDEDNDNVFDEEHINAIDFRASQP